VSPTGRRQSWIEQRPGHRAGTRFAAETTAPAHATALGKVLLAFAPAERVDAVIAQGLTRYTPFTLTDPNQLRKALDLTRLTRTAVSRRELDLCVTELAVPVSAPDRQVVAALSVRARNPEKDLRLLQPALMVAARSLSRNEDILGMLARAARRPAISLRSSAVVLPATPPGRAMQHR
jgi:DNA-binding IclR family transcriptional regulator